MASGLQDIPLRRIPEQWDRQWFAQFVRDVLRLADARNIKVSSEFDLTGQSDEVASLSMGLGGIDLDKLAQQPGLSVIGNPTNATASLQALVAANDLQVLRRSGTAVGFGLIDSTFISNFQEASEDVTAALIDNGTGISWAYNDVTGSLVGTVSLSPFSTTDLAEGTNLYFTTERAQDAVGAALTDTPEIDLTYDDGLNTISAALIAASVVYAKLQNVSATSRVLGRISSGAGVIEELTGANVATIIGYTAADVLSKLLTVDGSGSGLDADLLDGNSSAAFVLASSYTAADVLAKLLTVDGSGSGLDADLLDGLSSAAFLQTSSYQALTPTWSGDHIFSALVKIADGSVSAPSLCFTNDTDVGLYRIGTNNLGISVGNSKVADLGTTTGSFNVYTQGGFNINQPTASAGADAYLNGRSGGNNRIRFTTDGGATNSTLAFRDNTAGADRLTLAPTLTTNANPLSVTGNLTLNTAGNKLLVKEGTNASMGVATLVAGTVVVNTTVVGANSRIFLMVQALGTVAVASAIAVTARTAGTSFTITAAVATDTSTIAWLIVEPA
jgi:hypothetical protein